MAFDLADRGAIAGVGYTEFSKNSGVSTLTLALRAIMAALDDAGLPPNRLDGIATHRVGDSIPSAVVAQAVGIRDLSYFVDQFGGGGSSHAVVGQAALAVASGVADYVVCYRAINARSEFRMGGTARPAVDSVETQYQAPYGYVAPPQQYAMVAQAYMHRYGITPRHLAAVAMTQRRHAEKNARALMRAPMSYDDYLASRMVADPFRLLDCCLETDGAVAILVCSPERARDLRQPPVLVRAAAWGGGQTLFSNRQPPPGTSSAAVMVPRLYKKAGLGPADVDVAMIYDCFTAAVLIQLEDYGFCAKGEGGDFVLSGATALGGSLPVNTHGGFLSEGYVHGWNHIAEAVQQLRGAAGDRQVPGAKIALSTGAPGYVGGVTSALLLRGT
ncbi:MAG: Acetyl-CoA acetyltransferase-like protein [Rhodospirillales bacterium]|nr:Acetyl-CoA acetyltransferase-like protein [Rhodospirillales bacterium]